MGRPRLAGKGLTEGWGPPGISKVRGGGAGGVCGVHVRAHMHGRWAAAMCACTTAVCARGIGGAQRCTPGKRQGAARGFVCVKPTGLCVQWAHRHTGEV